MYIKKTVYNSCSSVLPSKRVIYIYKYIVDDHILLLIQKQTNKQTNKRKD